LCPEGPLPGTSQNSFPYSISGFIAEPSQSAQRPRANPAAVQSIRRRLLRGTTVCVLFCEYRRTATAVLHKRAVRQMALNGDAGRAFSFSALSSNSSGSRPFKPRDTGATPVRAAIFFEEAPVLISETGSRFALSESREASRRPESGRGRVYLCARGVTATWRSASPQSRVRLPARAPILELWCSTAAQRTFNPHGAGAIDSLRSGPWPAPAGAPFRFAPPAGSTKPLIRGH
jgi:hypothetical protein